MKSRSTIFLFFLIIISASCKIQTKHIKVDEKIPVIVITDLYHPHQDPGDNFDLINAYAIPNIDLKGVILDCHNPYRNKVARGVGKGLYEDKDGPREPGYIPVKQLNYIFGKNIPIGVGPFTPMTSKDDKMNGLSDYENEGIDLLKQLLEKQKEPVTIISTGYARVLAVANNRYPNLLESKVKRIHLAAGTSNDESDFLEWNVALDTNAFVSIMQSNLPIALYPCAAGMTEKKENVFNAFVAGNNNTYYNLKSMSFIADMPDPLKHYLHHVYKREATTSYLGILDSSFNYSTETFNRSQHMWETAIWMQVADMSLVKESNGEYKVVSKSLVNSTDSVFFEELVSSDIKVFDSGLLTHKPSSKAKKFVYTRDDPERYQEWMNKALPAFYKSIEIKR